MKKITHIATSAVITAFLIGGGGGGVALSARADEPVDIKSSGMFEAQDVLFDYRDFEELNRAIETGKANSYNQGYADGLANQPSINAKVTYTFHHHDIGNGDPTEVSFTSEEVENGTKDAWFASHPVPEKMTSPKGCYTKQNTHQERYIASYIHHEDCVHGTGEWVRRDDPQYECGYTMEWTGEIRVWDEPVYKYKTVSDGYVPACGHGEGECIRVIIDME